MNYQEATERHIEECKHRIDVITDFMKENKDSNKDKCLENIETLKAAISAMQELQAMRNNGISLERLKNIDFRKQVVEHINYMDYMDIKDELEEYKQIGTLEGVREAMEKQNECKDCGYKNHSDRISELNSCNDCGLANICEKRPEYGQYCRINCYDWRCMNER